MNKRPVINTHDRYKRVQHSELVMEVLGSSDFTVTTRDINAGLLASFPWLATEAEGWECFRIRSLVYEYNQLNSSQNPGSVMMAIDYDPTDAPPSSKIELLTFDDSISFSPWMSRSLRLDAKSAHGRAGHLFVRQGNSPQDLRLMDAGTFILAVQGTNEAFEGKVIGDLIVHYDIEFSLPQTATGSLVPQNFSKFIGAAGVPELISVQPIIGVQTPVTDFNSPGFENTTPASPLDPTQIELKEGLYKVVLQALISNLSPTAGTIKTVLRTIVDGVAVESATQTNRQTAGDPAFAELFNEIFLQVPRGETSVITSDVFNQTTGDPTTTSSQVENANYVIEQLQGVSAFGTQSGPFSARKLPPVSLPDYKSYEKACLRADPKMPVAKIKEFWNVKHHNDKESKEHKTESKTNGDIEGFLQVKTPGEVAHMKAALLAQLSELDELESSSC